MELTKRRLQIIDIMQGIAMLWVIIGHHLLPFMSSAYASFHYYIYSFHMPLFISISGFLIAYSYKDTGYSRYIYKRLKKFFVPYVMVGTIISFISALVNGCDTLLGNFYFLLFAPLKSEATFLWYIYLLFIFYALYPLVYHCVLKNNRFYFLGMGIAFVSYIYPIPTDYLCLSYFSKFLLFFWIGIGCGYHWQWFFRRITMLGVVSKVCLFIYLLGSVIERMGYQPAFIYSLICFSSLPATYMIARVFQQSRYISHFLEWVSKHCFQIYLIHMFFVQFLAAIYSCCFGNMCLEGYQMLFYIIFSSVFSITASVAFFRYVLNPISK